MKEKYKLSKSETQVMNILWNMSNEEGATSAEVLECYKEPRPALTTVLTFLKRLTEKGFIRTDAVQLRAQCRAAAHLHDGIHRFQGVQQLHMLDLQSQLPAMADDALPLGGYSTSFNRSVNSDDLFIIIVYVRTRAISCRWTGGVRTAILRLLVWATTTMSGSFCPDVHCRGDAHHAGSHIHLSSDGVRPPTHHHVSS